MNDFGKRLYKARKLKNLRQCDIERLTGITTASLSKLENGITDNPRQDTVNKLCAVLGEEWFLSDSYLSYDEAEDINFRLNRIEEAVLYIQQLVKDYGCLDGGHKKTEE